MAVTTGAMSLGSQRVLKSARISQASQAIGNRQTLLQK